MDYGYNIPSISDLHTLEPIARLADTASVPTGPWIHAVSGACSHSASTSSEDTMKAAGYKPAAQLSTGTYQVFDGTGSVDRLLNPDLLPMCQQVELSAAAHRGHSVNQSSRLTSHLLDPDLVGGSNIPRIARSYLEKRGGSSDIEFSSTNLAPCFVLPDYCRPNEPFLPLPCSWPAVPLQSQPSPADEQHLESAPVCYPTAAPSSGTAHQFRYPTAFNSVPISQPTPTWAEPSQSLWRVSASNLDWPQPKGQVASFNFGSETADTGIPDTFAMTTPVQDIGLSASSVLEDASSVTTQYHAHQDHVEPMHQGRRPQWIVNNPGNQLGLAPTRRIGKTDFWVVNVPKPYEKNMFQQCDVDGCSASFSGKRDFVNHDRRVHKRLRYLCLFCHCSYVSLETLHKHLKVQRICALVVVGHLRSIYGDNMVSGAEDLDAGDFLLDFAIMHRDESQGTRFTEPTAWLAKDWVHSDGYVA